MDYTTLSSIKTKLGITTNNSDSELNLIIKEATALIDNEIIINLEKKTIIERVDGTGSNKVYLKYKTSLINSIISKDGYTTYTLDFIDGYIVYLNEKTPKGCKNIIVNYEIGFDMVPQDIEYICLNICCILADKQNIKGTNSSKIINKNIQTQKLGNLSITYFGDKERNFNSFEKLNPSLNIEKVLNKYKPFIGLY